MKRYSIEAYDRAGTDNLRREISELIDSSLTSNDPPDSKAEARGHSRMSSITSQTSTLTDASTISSSTIDTRRSSVTSDYAPMVVLPDNSTSHSAADASRPSAFVTPLSALKAVWRRSKQFGRDRDVISIKKPGLMDTETLGKLVDDQRGGQVLAFRMSPGSYVGYGRLVETIDILSKTIPEVHDVAIHSQIFTLEELNTIEHCLGRFHSLRRLAILDVEDEPPSDCSTLSKITSLWGVACPTLEHVQFKKNVWWAPFTEGEKQTGQWVQSAIHP